MIKIEARTLEDAFREAALQLECSITEINIEVVQAPSSGFMGFFQKKAIIVAAKKLGTEEQTASTPQYQEQESLIQQDHYLLEEDDDIGSGIEYTADYDDSYDEDHDDALTQSQHMILDDVVAEIQQKTQDLFATICFDMESIDVSLYDEETIQIIFEGEDAALLIGKEGYRYKALSYMLFNWINAKYGLNLRLEIAEFLQNQEESVKRYLQGVYESVDRDGRAQTKILDGVLVQIALKELRDRYPDKYVVIRTNKEGLKYILINDYHN